MHARTREEKTREDEGDPEQERTREDKGGLDKEGQERKGIGGLGLGSTRENKNAGGRGRIRGGD